MLGQKYQKEIRIGDFIHGYNEKIIEIFIPSEKIAFCCSTDIYGSKKLYTYSTENPNNFLGKATRIEWTQEALENPDLAELISKTEDKQSPIIETKIEDVFLDFQFVQNLKNIVEYQTWINNKEKELLDIAETLLTN